MLVGDKNTNLFIEFFYFLKMKVKFYNSQDKYDINKSLETLSIIFFKHLYNYELRDLNKEKRNHPAIDLGDITNFVGIQVTTTSTNQKVKDTIDKFYKYKLNERYKNGLKIFIFEYEENEELKKEASDYIKQFKTKEKNIIGEDFVDVLFIVDLVNKFAALPIDVQRKCLKEVEKSVVKPIIKHLGNEEWISKASCKNGGKLKDFYEKDDDMLEDLHQFEEEIEKLSFESRVLLFDLIKLGKEIRYEEDLYLLKNVGMKIAIQGLSGNFDEICLHKFAKIEQELFIDDQDVPIIVTELRLTKRRHFGWASLRLILNEEERIRMLYFLDFTVLDV